MDQEMVLPEVLGPAVLVEVAMSRELAGVILALVAAAAEITIEVAVAARKEL